MWGLRTAGVHVERAGEDIVVHDEATGMLHGISGDVARVMEALPATEEQVEQATGLDASQVRGGLAALADLGLVVSSDERGRGANAPARRRLLVGAAAAVAGAGIVSLAAPAPSDAASPSAGAVTPPVDPVINAWRQMYFMTIVPETTPGGTGTFVDYFDYFTVEAEYVDRTQPMQLRLSLTRNGVPVELAPYDAGEVYDGGGGILGPASYENGVTKVLTLDISGAQTANPDGSGLPPLRKPFMGFGVQSAFTYLRVVDYAPQPDQRWSDYTVTSQWRFTDTNGKTRASTYTGPVLNYGYRGTDGSQEGLITPYTETVPVVA